MGKIYGPLLSARFTEVGNLRVLLAGSDWGSTCGSDLKLPEVVMPPGARTILPQNTTSLRVTFWVMYYAVSDEGQ